MYEEDLGIGKFILTIIGCVIALSIIGSCSKSCSRSESNMIYILEKDLRITKTQR